MSYIRDVFFLAFWLFMYILVFFSSFPFSLSIWTSFVSSCLFLVGTQHYDVSSVSVSAANHSAYGMYLIRTYADLSQRFIFV